MTRCQPIGIRDVLAYLLAALELKTHANRIYEIGGADVLTYRDMMLRYAARRGLRRRVIVVPYFTNHSEKSCRISCKRQEGWSTA
jgi:uncharacterized protein YbjT (DUF2867 family)